MNKTFITQKKSDLFSSFKGIDLQELLVLIENYFLEYRNCLNLPNYLTFGVEIEYEGISQLITDLYVRRKFCNWDSKKDDSLKDGGEVASPILTDNPACWNELLKICNHLSIRRANTFHNAGGHIHIGVNVLGNDVDAWKQFLKLNIAYEHILYRFLCGDKITGRSGKDDYARFIAPFLYKKVDQINKAKNMEQIASILPVIDKFVSINFSNIDFNNILSERYKNTFEYRGGNGTCNAIVWQNSINAIAKLSLASKEKRMNDEFLDYKLKHEFLLYNDNEYLYDCIHLKDALEFTDLVFDNNFDKICFLRQYLKSFDERYGINYAVKARRFYKK